MKAVYYESCVLWKLCIMEAVYYKNNEKCR